MVFLGRGVSTGRASGGVLVVEAHCMPHIHISLLGQGVSPGHWWQGQGRCAWEGGGVQCSSSLPISEEVYQNFNVSYIHNVLLSMSSDHWLCVFGFFFLSSLKIIYHRPLVSLFCEKATNSQTVNFVSIICLFSQTTFKIFFSSSFVLQFNDDGSKCYFFFLKFIC